MTDNSPATDQEIEHIESVADSGGYTPTTELRIRSLIARIRAETAKTEEDALGYATRIATNMAKKCYSDRSPEWKPLPDVVGILTQIDNMLYGMVRAETAKNSGEAVAWNRETLAIGMAALDGIVLQPIKSTVGPEEDANNWRKYLGRADDLIAYLSRSTQPTLDRTIRDVLEPFAKEAEKWPSDVDDSMKIACCSEITVGNLRAAVPLYGNPANSAAKNSGEVVAWQCLDKHGQWITMPGDWTLEENIKGYEYRPLYTTPANSPAKNSGEPIGYIAEHDCRNLKNNCFHADLARFKNALQHIPVYLATPANSRAEAIRAAGLKARDELIERIADKKGGSPDQELAEFMEKIVDACVAASPTNSPADNSGEVVGWRLVPIIPTDRMIEDAGQLLSPSQTLTECYDQFKEIWDQALASSPPPPTPANSPLGLTEKQIDAAQFCLSEFFPKTDGVTLRIAAKETVEAALDTATHANSREPVAWVDPDDCELEGN